MMSTNPDLPYAEYLKTWWNEGHTPKLDKRNRNTTLVAKIKEVGLENGYNEEEVAVALKIFMPRPSKSQVEMLAVFPNSNKYEADVPTFGRAGRIIKRVFPNLPESACERFSSWYKDVFLAEKTKMTLRVGTTREDFKHAFIKIVRGSGYISGASDKARVLLKSISASCMRYSFSDLGAHPAEAYASGDFEVVMVEVSGKVTARCVVYKGKGKYSPGPIYCSNTLAARLVDDYMSNVEGCKTDCDWVGAKMLTIPLNGKSYGRDKYVLPYIDYDRYFKWVDDQITIVGDADAYGNTNGYCYLP
jgi:hypothetical protein